MEPDGEICASCSNKRYRVIDYVIDTETYITFYRCRACQHTWKRERSLVSDNGKYKAIYLYKKTIPLHRFVYERFYNDTLIPGDIVHHLNLNKGDNRPANLIKIRREQHDGNKDLHYIKLIHRIEYLEQVIWDIKEGRLDANDVTTSGFREKIKNQKCAQSVKV